MSQQTPDAPEHLEANASIEKPDEQMQDDSENRHSAGSLDAIKVISEYSTSKQTLPQSEQLSGFHFDDGYHRPPRTLFTSHGPNRNYDSGGNTFGPPSHVTIHIGYNDNSPSSHLATQPETAPFDFGYIHEDGNFKPNLPSRSKSLPLPASPSVYRNASKHLQRMKSDPFPSKAPRDNSLAPPRRPLSGCITASAPSVDLTHDKDDNNDNMPPKTRYCNLIPYYVSLGTKTYLFPTILTCIFIFFCILSTVALIALLATAKTSHIGKDAWFAIFPLGALIGFSLWGIWGFRAKAPSARPIFGNSAESIEETKFSALEYPYNSQISGEGANRVVVDIKLDEKQKYRQTKIDDLEAQMFKVLAELDVSRANSHNSSNRITEIKEITSEEDDSEENSVIVQGKKPEHMETKSNRMLGSNSWARFSSTFSQLRFSTWSWTPSMPRPGSPRQTQPSHNVIPSSSGPSPGELVPPPLPGSTAPVPTKQLLPPPEISASPPPPPRRQLTGLKRPKGSIDEIIGTVSGKPKRSDSRKEEEKRRKEKREALRSEFGDVVGEISGPIRL